MNQGVSVDDQPMLQKEIIELDNAVVTPTSFNKKTRQISGCVYDQNGKVVSASQRILRQMDWFPNDPDTIDPNAYDEEIDGTAIYLGHYTGQYGHFLLESLVRFWIFKEDPTYDCLLFSPFVHRTPALKQFPPARVSFESFGLHKETFRLVDKCIRVKKLIIPSKLIELVSPGKTNPEARWIYQTIGAHCRDGYHANEKELPRKVYLSRRKWRLSAFAANPLTAWGVKMAGRCLKPAGISLRSLMNRPVVNENQVEELFRRYGFEILHPGNMPFEKQVSIYSQADMIAGFTGSAMHNSIFAKDRSVAIHLESSNKVWGTQRLCDQLAHAQTHVIEFRGDLVDPSIGATRVDINNLKEQLELIVAK